MQEHPVSYGFNTLLQGKPALMLREGCDGKLWI